MLRRLFFVIACVMFGASNSFADQSAKSTSAAKSVSPVKSETTTSHRGPNPARVGGAAKNAGNISGASVHLKH